MPKLIGKTVRTSKKVTGGKQTANYVKLTSFTVKEKEGNDQELGQPTPKTGAGKNLINNRVFILRKHILSRVSSFFLIDDHSVTQA